MLDWAILFAALTKLFNPSGIRGFPAFVTLADADIRQRSTLDILYCSFIEINFFITSIYVWADNARLSLRLS